MVVICAACEQPMQVCPACVARRAYPYRCLTPRCRVRPIPHTEELANFCPDCAGFFYVHAGDEAGALARTSLRQMRRRLLPAQVRTRLWRAIAAGGGPLPPQGTPGTRPTQYPIFDGTDSPA